MQPYSWTSNRKGRYFRAQNRGSARNGRYSGRTATGRQRRTVPHAGRDIGGPLGEPFPYFRAADAVSLPETRTQCRLCRTRLCTDGFCGEFRPDPGPDWLSRRPFRCTEDSADGPLPRRRCADRTRRTSELSLAARKRRAPGIGQQRLSSGQLRDTLGAHERSADGPRIFDPHLRRISWRSDGASHRGGLGDHGRGLRRDDRRGRDRPAGGAFSFLVSAFPMREPQTAKPAAPARSSKT